MKFKSNKEIYNKMNQNYQKVSKKILYQLLIIFGQILV